MLFALFTPNEPLPMVFGNISLSPARKRAASPLSNAGNPRKEKSLVLYTGILPHPAGPEKLQTWFAIGNCGEIA
jgi:hypothetical protein